MAHRALTLVLGGLLLAPSVASAADLERVIATHKETRTLEISGRKALLIVRDKAGEITAGPFYASLTRREKRSVRWAARRVPRRPNPPGRGGGVSIKVRFGDTPWLDAGGQTQLNRVLNRTEVAIRKRTPRTFGRIRLRIRSSAKEPERILTVHRSGSFKLIRKPFMSYLPPVLGTVPSSELAELRLDLLNARLGKLAGHRNYSFDRRQLEVTSPQASLRAQLSGGEGHFAFDERVDPLMARLNRIIRAAERNQPNNVFVGTVLNGQGWIEIKGDKTVRLQPSQESWKKSLARFQGHEVIVQGEFTKSDVRPYELRVDILLDPVVVQVRATAAGPGQIKIQDLSFDGWPKPPTSAGTVSVYGPLAHMLTDPTATHIDASLYLHANGTEAYVRELTATVLEETTASPIQSSARDLLLNRRERVWIVGARGKQPIIETRHRRKGVAPLDRLRVGRPAKKEELDSRAQGAAAALEKKVDGD